MTPGGIFDAYAKEITVWGRNDLKDVEDSNLGLKGSPTQIAKASDKVRKGAGEQVNLDPAASADYIVYSSPWPGNCFSSTSMLFS